MSYEEFKEKFLATLYEIYGYENISTTKVLKTNDTEDTALWVNHKGHNAVGIHIEQFFDIYCDTGNFMGTIERAVAILSLDANQIDNRNIFDVHNKDEVLSNVFCDVIGTEYNKKLLKEIPHMEFEDLSIVYRILGKLQNGISRSCRVTNGMMEAMNISINELNTAAMENTQRFFPPKIISLIGSLDVPAKEQKECAPLFVLTNDMYMFGATVIFYPDLLERIAEKLQSDLYLIPTSIHEFMVIPQNGSVSERELKRVLHEGNKLYVEKDEKLSSNIYKYKVNEKQLQLCKDHRQKVKELEH